MPENPFKIKHIPALFITVFLFTEISLRILQPTSLHFYWQQKQIHKYDEDYFVDLEADQKRNITHFLNYYTMNISTNEAGFRGTRRLDHSPKIGCIGDSVTMGFGVNDEDTFCSQIDKTTVNGTTYQSVNLGVDAYGPAAIQKKLEKYLPLMDMKLLYYFPSGGDDLDDYLYRERKQNNLQNMAFKTQFYLTKYSYVFLALKITQEQLKYRFIETFVWPAEKLKRTLECQNDCRDIYRPGFKSLAEDFFIPDKPADNLLTFPEGECTDKTEPYFIPDDTLRAVKDIISLTKKHNVKLVFVFTPTDLETAYCSQRGRTHRLYSYNTSLKKFVMQQGHDWLDLSAYTDRMKDDKGRLNARPYYIIGDGHYTPAGNKWVAEILAEHTERFLKK